MDGQVSAVLDVASIIATNALIAFVLSRTFLDLVKMCGGDRSIWPCRVLRTIRHELKPFRWLLLAVQELPELLDGSLLGWRSFSLGVMVLYCAFCCNDTDDDDRWKKRRDAVASKVAEVAGRLTVVPAGATS